ncbi:amidohydrolase family protein [Kutzneria sp. CA-103260]|uniref:amidohydrolase family protein n=1 Tax=Kutzneria sp. CA-103260 TaxID=2802641 RepID=UPI001BA44ECB|nr:amidohydrolase family protein [Kutzneria sp. CA-103260]QUQ63615.1 amidohydrolase [Kutzneria sp. CA-103260]
MQGKIALEEHFSTEETIGDSQRYAPPTHWPELRERLLDIQNRRVREMDENGVELMLLSLNSPAVQAVPDATKAVDLARRANDHLAEEIVKRPDRFKGFAALPMQDPEAAAAELRRAVVDLGFVGALVNGFSELDADGTVSHYDTAEYRPFWAEVERLDVPFSLHPRNPLPPDARVYGDHEWLIGPAWAFGHETAVHALRLIGSGLFDAHPGLRIVLGHLGENLPYGLWRLDNHNAWHGQRAPGYQARRDVTDYFRKNFLITTSGNFHTETLVAAIMAVGAERILFSTDWPFENVDHAAGWFDSAKISDEDRRRIGRDNAVREFRLAA